LREPSRLFIASDANPDALIETAWRAGRKLARGGVSNLICIAEPLNVLAAELGDVADRVTVILPWGNLLRAVVEPEIESLRDIAYLCVPGAAVEIVFSYDQQQDARKGSSLTSGSLTEEHLATTLPKAYEQAGLRIGEVKKVSQQELAAYETTWAKRLAFGRAREVWRLLATCLPVARSESL